MGMNGKITLVSSKGTGSVKEIQIVEGMTAKEVIFAELGMVDPETFAITVQGKEIKDLSRCKLHDEDFVIITPTNVKGS